MYIRTMLVSLFMFINLVVVGVCNAEVKEEFDPIFDITKTRLGPLKHTTLRGDEHGNRLYLNDRLLMQSRDPGGFYEVDFEPVKIKRKQFTNKSLFRESGRADLKPRYYVLDFSGKEVVISNSFEIWAEFDWVSWGKTNSVIVFKNGNKFIYENGKVRPAK